MKIIFTTISTWLNPLTKLMTTALLLFTAMAFFSFHETIVLASTFDCSDEDTIFNVGCYGTITNSSLNQWHGYSFQVREETVVTHLIGGATGGTFTVALYEGSLSDYRPVQLLGHYQFTGTGTQSSGVISLASGLSELRLMPGTRYFLTQGRLDSSAGSHLAVTSLTLVDILQNVNISHWNPDSPTQSHRWGNVGTETTILNSAPGLNSLIPAIGFLFEELVPQIDDSESTYPVPRIVASSGATNAAINQGSVVVDPTITILSDISVDEITVVIQNGLLGDVLSAPSRCEYNSNSFKLSCDLTESPSIADDTNEINQLLRTVRFSTSSTQRSNIQRQITFNVGNASFGPNSRIYRSNVNLGRANAAFEVARSFALTQTYYGLSGYLVTVTSQEENDFLKDNFASTTRFWIALSDSRTLNRWEWMAGPENGIHIASNRRSAGLIAVPGMYNNFSSGEPNSTNERCVELRVSSNDWNDRSCNDAIAFVVEFGDGFNTTSLTTTKLVDVHQTLAAPLNVEASGVFNSIVLTWAPPHEADSSLTNYQVEYRNITSEEWTIASSSIPSTVRTYSIDGLDPFSHYYVRIAAKTATTIGTYGYPWSKIYQVTNPQRSDGLIQYATGFGRASTDAYSQYNNSGFSRVRYVMSVDINGVNHYMDADFNKQIARFGAGQFSEYTLDHLRVPSIAAGQQFTIKGDVSDLSVFGSGLLTINTNNLSGRLELWPRNYSATKQSITPNDFSDATYDHNDTPSTGGSYGSFQLHQLGNSRDETQTLFAWNNHGASSPEIGFGNFTGTHRDWTFCGGSCGGRTNFSLGIFINASIATAEPSNTVEFFSNGGTGTMTNQYLLDDETGQLSSNSFVRSGYSFVNWNSQEDASGTVYSNQQLLTVSGVLRLYAQWQIVDYDVNFELNGGMVSSTLPTSYTVLTDFSTYQPTRAHYEFVGWFTDADFSESAVTSGIVDDRTVFAKYNEISYQITYLNENDDEVFTAGSYSIGSGTITLPQITPPSSYELLGWVDQSDSQGPVITTFGPIDNPSDKTFIARFSPIPFDITYVLNSGINAASNPASYSIETAVAFVPAIRVGYTFAGWYINANLTGDEVVGITMGSTNDITVHAKWTAKSYNVTFNANGGSGLMPPQAITFDQSANLTAIDFTYAGYEFDRWTTAADGSGSSYLNQSGFTMNVEDEELFAQWTPVEYVVTFDSNGGSLVANATITIESTLDELPQPSRLASRFLGWFDNVALTGSGITNLPLGTVANITLYAQWDAQPYSALQPVEISVPEMLYSGLGARSSITFTVTGLPEGVTFNPATLTFGGAPQIVSDVDESTFNVVLTMSGTTELRTYAFEMFIVYVGTLNFDTNGGNVIPSMNTNLAVALEELIPERLGYEFEQWHTNSGLNAPFNWSSGLLEADLTLYAGWTPIVYTITILEGLPSMSIPTTYTIESSDIVLPPLTQTGYVFDGWTPLDRIASGSTGNVTLTANWSPILYTFTATADGKTVARITVPFGANLASLNLVPPTKVGHISTGWSQAIPQTMPAQNVTITASYRIGSYAFTALDDAGTELVNAMVEFGAPIPYPEAPVKEGHTFTQWSSTASTMPGEALRVTAEYEADTFEVTYVDASGNPVGSASVKFGEPVTPIEPPVVDGFVFVEWLDVPATMPAEAITITGVFEVADVEEELEEELEEEPVIEPVVTIPQLPNRGSAQPVIIPEVVLPPNPDPVITQVRVNGVDLEVSIIPGQPVGVLPEARLDGYLFQGWMNSITGDMITPETVINNPDFVVLVPLFVKAPSLLDAARKVFESLLVNPFTKEVITNDFTSRTDNIQTSRIEPNEIIDRVSIPGGLELEVRADGSVTIPMPNERLPLSVNVTGLEPESTQVFYLLGTEVPEHHNENWLPYTGEPFLTNIPNQQVFLMVKDAFDTNQVTYLRPATFITNADKVPSTNFIQVATTELAESLVKTQQHTFMTQVEYEGTMVDLFVIEPVDVDDLVDVVVRYRADDHNKSLLIDVEAMSWREEILSPGKSLSVYLREGDNLDFNIEYRFNGRESVLESFQVTNAPTGIGILLPVSPNMLLRAVLGLLVVATISAPFIIKRQE